MRRVFLSFLSVVVLLLAGVIPVLAQESTPAGDLSGLGLPELDVTLNASGYEGIPESLAAGRYLVNLSVAADFNDEGGVLAFMQPVGLTVDDVLGIVGGGPPPGAGGMEMGTPPAGDSGEEDGGMAPPPQFYDFILAGGLAAPVGGSAQAVVDLTAGDWLAWADDPMSATPPVRFTVTGEMPADLAEPESSATLTLGEYTIEVTAGELKAGPQVLKVENIGAQPHFVYAARIPDGVTDEQIGQVLESEITGTPVDVGFDPGTDMQTVFNTGTQSTGTTMWLPVDLEPGTYALICFFPDMGDGMPHAMHGMHAVVTVSE